MFNLWKLDPAWDKADVGEKPEGSNKVACLKMIIRAIQKLKMPQKDKNLIPIIRWCPSLKCFVWQKKNEKISRVIAGIVLKIIPVALCSLIKFVISNIKLGKMKDSQNRQ